jgi:hypothetical protein
MRLLIAVTAAALFACSGESRPVSPLEGIARSALNCPVGTLTWSLDEGPEAGTIDQNGFYNGPACRPDFQDATYHVRVTGCGGSVAIPVQVGDKVRDVVMLCWHDPAESCCHPPPATTVPEGQVRLYAAVRYNCAGHIEYSAVPPPFCP